MIKRVSVLLLLVAGCGLRAVGVGPSQSEGGDGGASTSPDGGSDTQDAGGELDATVDATPIDASSPDAGPPAIVASASARSRDVTLPAPTKAGDLLVVLFAQNQDSSSAAVTSITDDATGGSDTFVSANQRSTNDSCGISAEIWFARNIRAGATHVSIDVSSSNWYDAWVVEVSGLATSGAADNGGVASSQSKNTLLTAPQVAVSGAPALVVSVAQSCSSDNGVASGVHNGNPFSALTALEGNGAAYYLANATGTFGAVFDSGDYEWNASTAAFR